MSDVKTDKRPDDARSPFAGCAILIAALVVILFLIGFSILTLFRQFDEIAKFTSDKAAPVELTPIQGNEEKVAQLTTRLEHFRDELAGKEKAVLTLSPEDLNLAIAAYEPMKELRSTFHVEKIEGDTMRLAISFPLNGRPRFSRTGERGWLASDSRYLNATLVAKPVLTKGEIVLALNAIEVPGSAVPDGFLGQMSPYRITERYVKDPVLGPLMKKVTRVEISGGNVVLSRIPGELPADNISNEQVDSGARRLFTVLGIAACVFLAFVGLIVLIGVRAKARKARDS